MEAEELVHGQCWSCEEQTECHQVTILGVEGIEEEVLLCPECQDDMQETEAETED